jgi:hypothetical protein
MIDPVTWWTEPKTRTGKDFYTREKSQNKFRTIEAIFQQFRMKMNEINSPGPEGIAWAADMDAKAEVEAAN